MAPVRQRALSAATTAAFLLPRGPAKNRLLQLLGHDVALDAVVHPSLVKDVGAISIGSGAHLGFANVIRGLHSLRLGDHAILGNWNWVSAVAAFDVQGPWGDLSIGHHAAVTSRHYIDASGTVSVGDFTTVAGVRSTIVTHGIDWRSSEQRARGVVIGSRCLVGSNCTFAPGSVVPDGSVLGMGAAVGPGLTEEGALHLAPRAATVRSGLTGAYFSRPAGAVAVGRARREPRGTSTGPTPE